MSDHRFCVHAGLADIAKRELLKHWTRSGGTRVVLKIGTEDEIKREIDIYNRLPGIFGWCLFSPSFSYISMEPFSQDLYGYVQDHGPMRLRQACEVGGTIVSANISLFIQDQF